MKKERNNIDRKIAFVISLSLFILSPGIARESSRVGREPIESKFEPGCSQEAIPQMPEKFKWFEKAKFGLFIHGGLFSIPASMWNGVPASRVSEYIMMEEEIPARIYEKLAGHFNPFQIDAERWVQMAEDAAMKYTVFVSKHHDGFAMYLTKVSPYNVGEATPWKRDPLEELAEACRRHNMRLGVYYSQCSHLQLA